MFKPEDLSTLVSGILELARTHEMDEATRRVQEARLRQADSSYENRASGVSELSLTIRTLLESRAEALDAVEELPDDVRFEATTELAPAIRELFDVQIARLRSEKRRMSKAR